MDILRWQPGGPGQSTSKGAPALVSSRKCSEANFRTVRVSMDALKLPLVIHGIPFYSPREPRHDRSQNVTRDSRRPGLSHPAVASGSNSSTVGRLDGLDVFTTENFSMASNTLPRLAPSCGVYQFKALTVALKGTVMASWVVPGMSKCHPVALHQSHVLMRVDLPNGTSRHGEQSPPLTHNCIRDRLDRAD